VVALPAAGPRSRPPGRAEGRRRGPAVPGRAQGPAAGTAAGRRVGRCPPARRRLHTAACPDRSRLLASMGRPARRQRAHPALRL